MKPRRTLRVLAVAAVLTLAAGGVLAQGDDWDLPAGFTPNPQPAPAMPQAPVGPIAFDEAEFPLFTPVNGLVVNSVGGAPLAAPLSFAFTSADAQISSGPGTTAFIDDPSIEGDAFGTLTIDFGLDVSRVAFGFAQSCAAPSTPSVTVTALDASATVIDSTNVAAMDFGFFFLENGVDFTPASPARSVEISFDALGGRCARFVVDNLAYEPVMVPALPPAALAVLALVGLASGIWLLRQKKAPV